MSSNLCVEAVERDDVSPSVEPANERLLAAIAGRDRRRVTTAYKSDRKRIFQAHSSKRTRLALITYA